MMKCSKCRAELSDDAKFCLYCGNKINVTTPSSTEEDSDSFKASHPEIAWSNGDKADAPKSLADKIKAKASDKWHKLSIYGKITTVALSVFVLLCLVALLFGKTAATMIAILQIVLTVTALLMKKQVIKVSQSWLHIVAFVFAAFLLVPYVSLFGMDYGEDDSKMNIGAEASEEYGTLMWSDSTIANLLPIPKSITGKITQDNEKEFTAYVSNTPIEEFNAYVASCADKGFTVDVSEAEQSFSVQNADGYRLSVSYQGNGVMSVSVSEPEYAVSLEIECVENLLFSKYDVDVYLDDFKQGTISHGTNETFNLNLTKGTYEIKFVSAEDDGVTGGVSIDIHQDESLKYKISCTSSQINVEIIQGTIAEHGEDEASTEFSDPTDITLTMGEADFKGMNYQEAEKIFRDMGFTIFEYRTVDTETECAQDTICYIEITEWLIGDSDFIAGDKFGADSTVTFFSYKYVAPAAASSVFYSTNDYETAKEGNTGVFSYRERGGSYDIYWIIDFDEGYVYYFTDGNGESFCDRLKIVSGTLNDKVIITYHDGGDEWSYSLHFKYVNHPETLIMVDNDGFSHEYSTTYLDDALRIRASKTITDY